MPAWIHFLYHFPGGDKLGHFILLAIGAFFINHFFRLKGMSVAGKKILIGSLVITVLITLEEFSQLFTRTRTFDYLDLTCSYLGILAGDYLIRFICGEKSGNMKKTCFTLLIIPAILSCFLPSCTEGDGFLACLNTSYLTIDDNEPPAGYVGQEYSFTITASISNEPADDDFDYSFKIKGFLPPGLTFSENNRFLTISGAPTAPGEYLFHVYVATPESEDRSNSDPCFHPSNWKADDDFLIRISE